MPVARPPKRRAESPAPDGVDPSTNHSFQLTFASPSSLTSDLPSTNSAQGSLGLQTTISFAPNVTPVTFTAPPSDDVLLDGESSRPTLFPDARNVDGEQQNLSATKRRRKTGPSQATLVPTKSSNKRVSKTCSSSKPSTPVPDSKSTLSPNSTDAPAHIPRPPNAFILFRSSFIRSQHVSAKTEGNHGTLSKIVGMLWHSLSYEERQVWQAKARRAYAEHKRMYPGYSFRPTKDKISSNSKTEREGTPASDIPSTKRKTRTVGPRDLERCEHIAALLARGLKGAELDAAVKEFDAVRAPQTFTPRFEAPLTAQTYAAASKDKDAKSNHIKKEVDDDIKAIALEDEKETPALENTVEQMVQPTRQGYHQVDIHSDTPALVHVQPRRVRRSSSAPLLDAGLPISAPTPQYPASSHAHFFQSETPRSLHFTHQQHNFGLDHRQAQQHTFEGSFGYPQGYQHTTLVQEGMDLRKRSATSSPHLRRPSYSFSHSQANPQSFGHNFASYSHQQDQQPFAHSYSAAHPHLQRMQAQALVESHARAENQQVNQTSGVGLDLGFNQNESLLSYGPRHHETGGLSRQSTLTDISEDGASATGGSGFWNESVDFGNFSFSNAGGQIPQTPVSTHPANRDPFDVPPLSNAPSSSTVDEVDYTYADMPGLVDAPLYQNFYKAPIYQAPAAARSQHPHLEIQTSWTSEEYTYEQPPASAATLPPSSALDTGSVPTSAVDGSFDFPSPNTAISLDQGYADYATQSQQSTARMAVPTPCSPASQSTSGAASSGGARTPIDDGYSAWDRRSASTTTATAAASPVATYDGCGVMHPDNDSVAREHALALQAGFRTYLAHAEKIGAIEVGASEVTFEEFARFVRDGVASATSIVGGMNKGMSVGMTPMAETQAQIQMAQVM